MKTKKCFILIGFIITLGFTSYAQKMQVTASEIINATYAYLKNNYPATSYEIDEVVKVYDSNDNVLLYEVVLQNKSILFSGHRACHPILADYNHVTGRRTGVKLVVLPN